MTALLKAYRNLLFRYPYACQALQTGVLMGTGDAIAQTVIERKPLKNFNFKRTAQFFSVGVFFMGPTLTMWYGLLNKHVGSSGKIVVLKKVAVDQLCFAPVCLMVVMGLVKTLQGNSFEKTKEEVSKNYWEVLMANYKVWPAVQIVNFYFVPLQYQVLLVQIVALFWNSYFCFKTRPVENQSNLK